MRGKRATIRTVSYIGSTKTAEMKIYVEHQDYNDEDDRKYIALLLGQFVKYKAMWALRESESEINEQGGIITFIASNEEKPSFRIEGFSEELTEKINTILFTTSFVLFDK